MDARKELVADFALPLDVVCNVSQYLPLAFCFRYERRNLELAVNVEPLTDALRKPLFVFKISYIKSLAI